MRPRNRTNDGDGDGRVKPRIQRGAINPEKVQRMTTRIW
jgi:hypothetical protein